MVAINISMPTSCKICKFKGSRLCFINVLLGMEYREVPQEGRPNWCPLAEIKEADRWIPVTERLPKTTDPVNVTWTNNDPAPYYADIKGKRFTACAHYHREKWWWHSAVCQDLLDEYGKSCMDDEIDEAIEILAWRPLPEPYTEEKA